MNMSLRAIVLPVWGLFYSLGFDPRRLKRIVWFPLFLKHSAMWWNQGGKIDNIFPIIGEWHDSCGTIQKHYFYQDLLVATAIFKRSPGRHIDIGSRIDGFVAHVATFRELEVMDIRQLHIDHPNIKFRRSDLMNIEQSLVGVFDSLSCLHAIEHFGLGRYGDPIDPKGHLIAFRNLIRMLSEGGFLYISFPIGRPRVEFNAHRVFSASEIFDWEGAKLLELIRFDYVNDCGELMLDQQPMDTQLEELIYGCGIYTFRKISG